MLLKSCAVLLTLLSLGAAAGTEVYLDPNTALRGVYTECVFRFDWPCFQRRTLLFVDRLGRASEYPLLPGLSLVRTSLDDRPPLLEDEIIPRDSGSLGEMVDTAIDTFFDEHVFRITFPRWFRDTGRSSKDHVDFFFGDIEQEKENTNGTSEARGANGTQERMLCSGGGGCKKKGGGKKGMKMMKKCLMAACMMMAGKAMLLAPLMMFLMKIMALKSMAMAGMSLMMSKMMILKKFMKNKMMMQDAGGWQPAGGGGGGWQPAGGGGGGWDNSGGGAGGGGWQDGGAGGGAEGPYRRTAYYRSAPAYRPPDIIHNAYSTVADED